MNRRVTLLAALVAAGCGYDSPLVSVTFPFVVQGLQTDPSTGQARTPDAPLTFQTAVVPGSGEVPWTVTLMTAEVALGPVYFYNAPAFTSTEAVEGRVVSEVLATFDVDALDPTPVATTPGGVGDNETVLSISVWLTEDQSGPIATNGGAGAVMYAVGTAQRTIVQDGAPVMQTVPFAGVLQFPTTLTPSQSYSAHHSGQFPVYPAAPTTGFTPNNGGMLTLQVDPTHWFDNIDFERLASPGASPPFGFANITQQLETTVLEPTGFTFTWASPDS